MEISKVLGEITQAFAVLDDRRLRQIGEDLRQENLLGGLNDAGRIGLAFGYLAAGEVEKADSLLEGATGDGTAPLADFAYVRAFRREIDQDFEGLVAVLSHHLGDPGATHPARMRLRVADALMKLGRYGEVPEALGPLLEPPGVPQTLEAQFVLLEAAIKADTANREFLIERVSLIDALLERGFRLGEAGNVVYYASMMEKARIEPVIEPLLRAHEPLLDKYTPQTEVEIAFLINAGNRFKNRAAVRTAARGFAQNPFKLEGADPVQMAQIFSSHGEHQAARQVVLTNLPNSRIRKDQKVWGPLIMDSYYAKEWKAALELIREHRNEIAKQATLSSNMNTVRAVCEFYLDRFEDCLKTIAQVGSPFYLQVAGHEAAVEPLAMMGLRRFDDVKTAATRCIRPNIQNSQFTGELVTAVLDEAALRGWEEGIDEWLVFLNAHVTDPAFTMRLQRFGEFLFEWSLGRNTRSTAALMEERGEQARALLLRGLASAQEGFAQEAQRHFGQLLESPAPIPSAEAQHAYARCLRRLGLNEDALAAIEPAAGDPAYPRRYQALGLKGGILRDLGRKEEVQPVLNEAGQSAKDASTSQDQLTMMLFQLRQAFTGDSPEAALAEAENYKGSDPASVEIVRMARMAATAWNATDEQKKRAEAIVAEWWKTNRRR